MVGGVPDEVLVVRAITSPYNYDYVIDYVFHVNGVLDQNSYFTGYPQNAARDDPAEDPKYGFPSWRDTGGTLHAHVLGWKVDLDVAGNINSVEEHSIKVNATANRFLGGTINIPRMETAIPATEDDAIYFMNPSEPKVIVIINEAEANEWGISRGYRIINHDPIGFLFPDDDPALAMAPWAKNHLYVTQRHDDEPTFSTIYHGNSEISGAPFAFDTDIINGESIRNKDIVALVSVGHWHVPTAEDAPVTSTPAGSNSWSLKPFNFYGISPDRDMASLSVLRPNDAGDELVQGNEALPNPLAVEILYAQSEAEPNDLPRPFNQVCAFSGLLDPLAVEILYAQGEAEHDHSL
jgi:diamine oxidase